MAISRKRDKDLTLLTVLGDTSFEELMDVIREVYEKFTTKHLIYDFSHGTFVNASTENIKTILQYVKKHGEVRKGGKTAYVGGEDYEFGMLRMTEALAQIEGLPVNIEVFRSLDKAIQWVGKED